jgi:hypothetical protein
MSSVSRSDFASVSVTVLLEERCLNPLLSIFHVLYASVKLAALPTTLFTLFLKLEEAIQTIQEIAFTELNRCIRCVKVGSFQTNQVFRWCNP